MWLARGCREDRYGASFPGRDVSGDRVRAYAAQRHRAHDLRGAARVAGRRARCSSTPADATAPAALVRLLQFAILPEILGESAGPAIYLGEQALQPRPRHPLHPGAQGLVRADAARRARGRARRGARAGQAQQCLSCQRLPADRHRRLRPGARHHRRRARGHHRHRGRHQGDALLGPRRHRVPVRGLQRASRPATCITRTASTPTRSGGCSRSSPTSPRSRWTTCVCSTSGASTRRTTRSPGSSTSASCASAPRSSWRAPSGTAARWPS